MPVIERRPACMVILSMLQDLAQQLEAPAVYAQHGIGRPEYDLPVLKELKNKPEILIQLLARITLSPSDEQTVITAIDNILQDLSRWNNENQVTMGERGANERAFQLMINARTNFSKQLRDLCKQYGIKLRAK